MDPKGWIKRFINVPHSSFAVVCGLLTLLKGVDMSETNFSVFVLSLFRFLLSLLNCFKRRANLLMDNGRRFSAFTWQYLNQWKKRYNGHDPKREPESCPLLGSRTQSPLASGIPHSCTRLVRSAPWCIFVHSLASRWGLLLTGLTPQP